MERKLKTVNLTHLTRTGTALIAGAALFAGVATAAGATPTNTFNVSTTITASCTVTDSGPANLTPTYTPSTDSGTGSETVLNTFCSGSSPTVAFTDAYNNVDGDYAMNDGNGHILQYQLSNTPTCSGIPGDGNMGDTDPEPLTAAFDICAGVIVGGVNVTAPAGSYTDTVTYSITP
jgi:hypothetical protein